MAKTPCAGAPPEEQSLADSAPKDEAYQKAKRVKELHWARLMEHVNVVGVGVGRKRRGGRTLPHWCIVVYVSQKFPASSLPPEEFIPPEIEGVPTDVVEVGVPIAYAP
jgi:hypothetical protein